MLDSKNLFSNFQPQAFAAETKPNIDQKSFETGESETVKTTEVKKEDKPLTSLFGAKPLSKEEKPLTNLFGTKSSNVNKDNVQKPQEGENKYPIKVVLKAAEKSKENVPEKVEIIPKEPQKPAADKKDPEVKPLSAQSFNFGSSLSIQPTATSANTTQSKSADFVFKQFTCINDSEIKL